MYTTCTIKCTISIFFIIIKVAVAQHFIFVVFHESNPPEYLQRKCHYALYTVYSTVDTVEKRPER